MINNLKPIDNERVLNSLISSKTPHQSGLQLLVCLCDAKLGLGSKYNGIIAIQLIVMGICL
jgi:hypothetical protein